MIAGNCRKSLQIILHFHKMEMPRRPYGERRAASKERSRRSLILSFKTARRYLRKRHSSSDSGGVTHTFAIRFITASIAIRMAGKNKKLKAGKNRGKGTRVSSPTVTDSRSPSPLCEKGQAVEEHNVCELQFMNTNCN